MNSSPEDALFALALAKPPEKRAAFLEVMCNGDAALRARLEALLAAHEQPETLLATQTDTARPTIKLDLADAPDEAVGQMLGRYKLLEQIGEGGCGMEQFIGTPACMSPAEMPLRSSSPSRSRSGRPRRCAGRRSSPSGSRRPASGATGSTEPKRGHLPDSCIRGD